MVASQRAPRPDQKGDRAVGFDAGLWRERPRAAAAAPFDFPWLDQPGETKADAAGAPAPIYGEAELRTAVATARAESAAESAAKVRAELSASMAAQQAATLERIVAELAGHQAAFERALAARASASRELALALAQALVPRALERQPLADVDAMLRDLLVRLERAPRLSLSLPPALVDAGQKLLADAAAQAGYRGELSVVADPALGAGDARLDWQSGYAERDLAALEREVIAVVDAWLPRPEAEPLSGDRSDDSRDGSTP